MALSINKEYCKGISCIDYEGLVFFNVLILWFL